MADGRRQTMDVDGLWWVRLSAVLLLCCFASGCLERTVTVTSEPPGALVYLNDTEVGRTPVSTEFVFYGDFDVRLRKEGHEPLVTHQRANAPIYEMAPIDLLATAWPGRIKTERKWHFVLEPSPPSQEDALLERARGMRSEVVTGGER